MKRINLRLDVTETERDLIRKAAALAGHRSMAEFCRMTVLTEAQKVVTNVALSVADRTEDKKKEGI